VQILRDAIELKKLNAGLMKTTAIDDLIADTYAKLYEEVGVSLRIENAAAEPPPNQNAERAKAMSLHNLINQDTSTNLQSSAPKGLTVSDPPTRQRIKGVGRREVQRKAEAAAAKPVSTLPVRPPPRAGDPNIQVVIEPRKIERDETAAGVESSAPGSVHDSADDESELTEFEDEQIIKPSPPNSTGRVVQGLDLHNGLATSEEGKGEPKTPAAGSSG
jgi:hypothetical protein